MNTTSGISMNSTSGISITSLITALATGPAPAGDKSTSGEVSGGEASGSTGDVGSLGDVRSVGDIGSFGDFLKQLNAGNLDGNAIGEVGTISAIDVEDLFRDFDVNALNDALSGNTTHLAALQHNLNGNSMLQDFLTGNNISISDVVGVDNNQDGSLIVYTNSED